MQKMYSQKKQNRLIERLYKYIKLRKYKYMELKKYKYLQIQKEYHIKLNYISNYILYIMRIQLLAIFLHNINYKLRACLDLLYS